MNRCIKLSIIFNSLITILTVIACIIMFTGFKFMSGPDLILNDTFLDMFKYYTVDSNILMGLSSLIFIIYSIKLLNNKIDSIPKYIYLLKLIGTVGVSLTFFVVFTYLSYISKYGIYSMIMNSNLFFHLIIPVLSIITFIFFEKNNKLSFKDSFYGISSMVLYSVFYISNVLIHLDNGKVSVDYDWYYFVQNGIWSCFIVIPIIFIITYLISFCLWKFNRINK